MTEENDETRMTAEALRDVYGAMETNDDAECCCVEKNDGVRRVAKRLGIMGGMGSVLRKFLGEDFSCGRSFVWQSYFHGHP